MRSLPLSPRHFRAIAGGYGALVVALTVLLFVLDARVSERIGLQREVYPDVGFSGIPRVDVSRGISLDFLREDPALSRRFFSVRWNGFWYLPEAGEFELHGAGDDHLDVCRESTLRRRHANPHTTGGVAKERRFTRCAATFGLWRLPHVASTAEPCRELGYSTALYMPSRVATQSAAMTVWVDSERVIRRGAPAGMHTQSRTLWLEAGVHRLRVDYEQHGEARALSLPWAPRGERPRPARYFQQVPWSGV